MDNELKVEWILKIEKLSKCYYTHYIGMKFYENDSYFEEFRSEDQNLMRKLREILKKRMNQSNFHDFYKAIKKRGKGNLASVILKTQIATKNIIL